jgi:mannose-6-phosphate isomerase-like protein (cupin superfamily)
MRITRIEEGFSVMEDEDMAGKRLYASPGATIIHITIHPGRAIEPHATPVDMEFFVLEGRGLFTIGGEEAEAGQGSLVEGPKNLVHGIRNLGEAPLRVLAIKNS